MNDIAAIGLAGIQRELTNMQQSAMAIANPNSNTEDMTRALVSLHQGSTQVKADAKVLTVANQMIGSLLDVFV